MKFHGSFPALITPFTKEKKINYIELNQLAEMHMHHSDGLVLCGSTGEGWLLSLEEKLQVIKNVQHVFKKPIIVNSCVWSADDFLSFVKAVDHLTNNIEAFLVAAPPYLKLNERQTLQFYKVCAEASPKPIIVYHIPSRNNIEFTNDLMDFFNDHPHIIGIKETRWSHIEDYIHLSNMIQFAGDDEFIGSSLIQSSINVGGNLFPEIFSQYPHTFPWQDWQKLLNMAANPLVIKVLMAHHGLIEHAACRDPLGEVPPSLAQQIINVFQSTVQNNVFAHGY